MSFTVLAILSGEDDAAKESVPSDPGPFLFAPLRVRRGAECATRLQSRDAFEFQFAHGSAELWLQPGARHAAPCCTQDGKQADRGSLQGRARRRSACHTGATIGGRKSHG